MYKASVLMKQISVETYSKLQENMFLMPGFFVQTRTLRKYPYSTASHLLGYVGEVNERLLKKNPYYKEHIQLLKVELEKWMLRQPNLGAFSNHEGIIFP